MAFLVATTSLPAVYRNPGTFQCKDCVIQITFNEEVLEEEESEGHDEVKMAELATIVGIDESTIATTTQEVNLPQYQCDQCDVRCNIEENLRAYIKNTHSVEMDIACNNCFFITSSPTEMQTHIEVYHGDNMVTETSSQLEMRERLIPSYAIYVNFVHQHKMI